jgi:hypothetical protein
LVRSCLPTLKRHCNQVNLNATLHLSQVTKHRRLRFRFRWPSRADGAEPIPRS